MAWMHGGIPRDAQRRRPPPPPRDRELLRLCVPRELAARSERPLEYPEKASDLVPLRSVGVRAVPLVVPRASAVPEPRVCVLAVVPDARWVAAVVPVARCVPADWPSARLA